MAERLSADEVEQQAMRIEAATVQPDEPRFMMVADEKGQRMVRLTPAQIAQTKAQWAAARAEATSREAASVAAKQAEDAAFEARVAAAVEAALAKRESKG